MGSVVFRGVEFLGGIGTAALISELDVDSALNMIGILSLLNSNAFLLVV